MGRKLMTADDYEVKIRELEASAPKLEEEKAALMKDFKSAKMLEQAVEGALEVAHADIKAAEFKKKSAIKTLNKTTRERRNLQRKIREKEAEIRALPYKINRYRRIVEKVKMKDPDPEVREKRTNRLGEVLDKITGVPTT